MRKGFAQIILLSAILTIVALVIIGFLLYQNSQRELLKTNSSITPTPISNTQDILITHRNDYLVTKGILIELNISGNDKIILSSKPKIVSSHPDYLPGNYKFAAKVLSSHGNILGEYGFEDPRIKFCEMGADCTPLDESNFTLIIPYWEESKSVDIYSGSRLMLSIDTLTLKED
jgi:hypothetical protein